MAAPTTSRPRVSVDGKFFRLGGAKFHVKGVTYGPFCPVGEDGPFATPEQTREDFALIQALGANVLRVYHVPPRWLLDLAEEHGLKVFVDVPWDKHLCFLDDAKVREAARAAVREAARACAGHPAVFALCVVNEIPQDIARWSGAAAVTEFIEELVEIAKSVDPECLCTFANYPPTEFLRPRNIDFVCFNVYLHQQKAFENYLARLQTLAETRPLLLGETGIDSTREGEEGQLTRLSWQIEAGFRAGLAGVIVYSFTDDWFKEGRQVGDWTFGLTTRERRPKPAFQAVQLKFLQAPRFALPYYPMVSVVVASYNGDRTLKSCLESLVQLNYPHYEVLLVDDGSTDTTPQIASLFPNVRCLRFEENQGLSVARNAGIALAQGEIIAFTDSDCRADEDWLHYLVGDLLNSCFAGIGGHNLLPPEDSWVASAVMVSPGGPAHVMLTDRLAEHIPGCNMAFYKWALDEVGGFDPLFRKAGDDVDICWRLQQNGYQLGFSHAGFVWHYRRSNLAAYLRQQRGYGEAEAMLVRKHPEYFNALGGSMWQGRIYSPARTGLDFRPPIIYHGPFGSALFQSIYAQPPSGWLSMLTSLEYHILITLPLLVLGTVFQPILSLGISSLLVSLGLCVVAAAQAELPRKRRRLWSRPLVALLFFLQPIVRGWARYQERLRLVRTPLTARETLDTLELKQQRDRFDEVEYWTDRPLERVQFLRDVITELEARGWENRTDSGWNVFDVEVRGSRWCHLQLVTAAENHGGGRTLIRCRLRPVWSLPAKVAFGVVLGIELLVIGVLGGLFPWLSAILLSLLGLVWWLHQQERDLQRILSKFLDDVAKSGGLIKIDHLKEEIPSAGRKAQADARQGASPERRT
jgi:O-antigen biosynthesis protein